MAYVYILALSFSLLLLSYLWLGSFWALNVEEKVVEYYKEKFSYLLLDYPARRAAHIHLALLAMIFAVALSTASFALGILLPVLAMLPPWILSRKQETKVEDISEQLAPWLTVIANSLKSAPNILDALETSVELTPRPLRDEIALLVREVQLGEHLDTAMYRSAKRLESPLYSSVMTTLLVARRNGGNLPNILEENSDVLREMERLAGVVRTKTAEGRSQSLVLAALPFVAVAALEKTMPGMVTGLADTFMGSVLLGISFALWAAAVVAARRIVEVDI